MTRSELARRIHSASHLTGHFEQGGAAALGAEGVELLSLLTATDLRGSS